MKKLLICLFLIIGVLLSGCTGGSSKTEYPEEDNTGYGLEVDFRINDEWISQRQLNYYISLKNSGKEPITLSQENFRLGTVQRDGDSTESIVFTQESINLFYRRLLGEDNSLKIYQNTPEINSDGQLKIEEDFFNDVSNSKLDYFLKIEYSYRTEFSNNIVIDLSQIRNKIDIVDRLDQAAPIKVEKIDLVPNYEGYKILYYIRDRGPSSDDKLITLGNFEFEFGARNRISSCDFFSENDRGDIQKDGEEIIINKKQSGIIYACDVDLTDVDRNEPTGFVTSGSFEYDYMITIRGSQRLPEKRGENSFFIPN